MSQAATKAELPKYVGYAEIAEATGIERHTIQRLMKRGKFPKPDALPTKENRWRLSVVSDWLAQRNAEQIAALSDSAVTDPAKLKPEQVAAAAFDLSKRYLENELGREVDAVAIGEPLSGDALGQLMVAMFVSGGRMDTVRALLVTAAMFPTLRPLVVEQLYAATGTKLDMTESALNVLAMDILEQGMNGQFVEPRDHPNVVP